MTNTKDKELIDDLKALVAKLLAAANADKTRARKYTRARGKVELAMRAIGEGIPRPPRPDSVPLPVHERMPEQESWPLPVSDFMADNTGAEPAQPKKKK